jgi:glucokinase
VTSPAIGIDVGASKVVGAVVDSDGRVQDRVERARVADSNEAGIVAQLVDMIEKLSGPAPDAPVGVGIAGIVHWPAGEIEFAANHGHRKLKLRRRLEAACGRPVVVDNDANVAAWAEARAGRYDAASVLFLAVGTGLGSGFVMDGSLVRGHRGRGAELGHVVVDRAGGRRCRCGLVGCLEAVASGWALERDGRAAVRAHPEGTLARLAVRPELVTARLMIDVARRGDAEALHIVAQMGRRLGRTVADNVMSLLPVERVVVGGGLANLDRLLIDPMRSGCDKAIAKSSCYTPPVFSPATFGDDSVVVGAALLAINETAAHEAAAHEAAAVPAVV